MEWIYPRKPELIHITACNKGAVFAPSLAATPPSRPPPACKERAVLGVRLPGRLGAAPRRSWGGPAQSGGRGGPRKPRFPGRRKGAGLWRPSGHCRAPPFTGTRPRRQPPFPSRSSEEAAACPPPPPCGRTSSPSGARSKRGPSRQLLLPPLGGGGFNCSSSLGRAAAAEDEQFYILNKATLRRKWELPAGASGYRWNRRISQKEFCCLQIRF